MIGQKFGDRVVLYEVEPYHGCIRYACKCKCGLISLITRSQIKSKKRDRCSSCASEIRYPFEREIGKKYGKWTIYKYIGIDKKGEHLYKIRCECGSKQISIGSILRLSKTKQCRKCYLHKDMIGKSFNSWTVLRYTSLKKSNRLIYYECVCICGKKQNVSSTYLRNGKSNRCRYCANKENNARRWKIVKDKD